MVTTKLNLSMTEPQVRQIYAKQGDTGRVLDITLDQTPEDGTLRILRPDGTEVTSEAVTGGEVSESGETVTFESLTEADVTELTVGIEPVQDLNGYDAPWVGGAGKNKLPYPYGDGASKTTNGITYTVSSDGSVTANGTATADNVFYLISSGTSALANKGIASGTYILNGSPSESASSNYYIQLQYNGTFVSAYASGTTFTYNASGGGNDMLRIYVKSGAVLNNVKFYPMIRLSTETDPTWQPYSNICPITGHDEVAVTETGKNKYPILIGEDVWQDNASATHTNDGGTLKIEMNASVGSGVYGDYSLSAITPLSASLPQGSYTISFDAMSSVAGVVRIRYESLGTNTFNLTTDWQHYSFTVNLTGTLSAFIIYNAVATAKTVYVKNLQIEQGSTATAYEPYQSNTYTTSLGQTVYGGTLDLVSGVLTVDGAISVYQGSSDEVWTTRTTSSGYTLFEIGLSNVSVGIPASQVGLCNEFAWNRDLVENIRYRIVNSTLTARYDGLSLADWKTFLASNPMQVVYPLATPMTYTLTAQQIKTLVGTNNVWASSGDIISIKFTYGGLLSELPSEATEIVGKCYCDVEQNGVSSMPFTLNVKKNERES